MIKLNGHIITPTIFPDGTSQVWKLKDDLWKSSNFIEWKFEQEREIFDLLGLCRLKPINSKLYIDIPFLPFARQDKCPNNNRTFNLYVFNKNGINLLND